MNIRLSDSLPSQRRRVLAATLLAAMLASTSALADTLTWTGATDGTWGTTTNWSTSAIPTSSDDLTILGPGDVAGALNINIAAAAAANSINFTNTAATTLTNTTSGANQTLTFGAGGLTTGTGSVAIGSTTANQNVNIALGASQTWNVGSGGLTVTNVISGTSFGITKSGSGTLTLQGANTYTGATQINQGTVSFKGGTALANFRTNTTIASGATLKWDATGIGGNATNDTMGAAVASSAVNGTYKIDGTGTLLITGNSTDFLGLGNANGKKVEFALGSGGLIDIQGGTLRNGGWQGGVWTNNKADLNIASGAALDIWDGNAVFVDALTGSGNVTNQSNSNVNRVLTVGVDNGSGTFSGVIGGGTRLGINHIAITKTGSGTQILSGDSTYTGATTISAGTLQIGNGGTTGSIASTSGVTNNATLAYNRSDALTVGYVISGTGVLIKDGTGTLTLSAVNTYTGATSVNAGTLALTGSLASSAITVGNGATFTNNGTVTGSLEVSGILKGAGSFGATTIKSGGALNPGNSPGTQSYSSLTLLEGSTTTMEIENLSSMDLVTVSGTLVYGGSLVIEAYNNYDLASVGSVGTYSLFNPGSTSGTFSSVTLTGIGGLTSNGSGFSGTYGGLDYTFVYSSGDLTIAASAIPEPSTYAGLAGLVALGVVAYRRRRRA